MIILDNSPDRYDSAKAVSPIFDRAGADSKYPEMRRNGPIAGTQHINRIILTRTAHVELLYAESPDKIYVRLNNHIADQFIIREPYNLKKFNTAEHIITMDDYCLAPIKNGMYARARVVEVIEATGTNGKRVRVLFIDEGITAWVNPDCLAQLDDSLTYHPWQAICVSIRGIKPKPVLPKDGEKYKRVHSWSPEDCDLLRRVLSEFPVLKTKTMMSSKTKNDYEEPIKVQLFGVKPEIDEYGVEIQQEYCIARIMAMDPRGSVIPYRVIDAANEPRWNTEVQHPLDESKIPPFRCNWPEKWRLPTQPKTKNDDNTAVEEDPDYKDWDPSRVAIETLDVKWLYDNECVEIVGGEEVVWISIESSNTVSPYEFYGRPTPRFIEKEVQEAKVEEKKVSTDSDEEMEETGNDFAFDENEMDATESAEKLKVEIIPLPPTKEKVRLTNTEMMLTANKKLKDKARILDSFYSREENRRSMERAEIEKWLREENKRVYGICSCSERRGSYTGEWQRVEMLRCDESFVTVMFLDSGGQETVTSSSLYKIHPIHCKYPPLCMQLCLQGLADKTKGGELEWGDEAAKEWKTMLRGDVPIALRDIKQIWQDVIGALSLKHIFMRADTFFVRDVRINQESVTLADRLLNKIPKDVEKDDTKPVPWDN